MTTTEHTINHEPSQHIIDEHYSDWFEYEDVIPYATEEEETHWMHIMMFTNDPTIWC